MAEVGSFVRGPGSSPPADACCCRRRSWRFLFVGCMAGAEGAGPVDRRCCSPPARWPRSRLQDQGVKVVGDIPAGLPTPALPAVSAADLSALMLPAVGVAIVGVHRQRAHRRGLRHPQWLPGRRQPGAARARCGQRRPPVCCTGFPVSSSAAGPRSGRARQPDPAVLAGRSRPSVVADAVRRAPFLAAFPTAALGRARHLRGTAPDRPGRVPPDRRVPAQRAGARPGDHAAVCSSVCSTACSSRSALSILDLLRRVARPHDGILGYVPGVAGMHDIDDYPDATPVPGLVVYRYDAPLCLRQRRELPAAGAGRSRRIADAGRVVPAQRRGERRGRPHRVDALRSCEPSSTAAASSSPWPGSSRTCAPISAAGLVERVGDDRIFPTLPTAVQGYVDWYTNRHAKPPAGISGTPAAPGPTP